MLKMTDVAKRANVSVATISRVLNNKDDVSDDTRKRVWEIIDEMNYVPNQVARTLYHKSSHIIGVVVPDLINPFYPEILEAIEEKFHANGYHVLLFNIGNNEEKEQWHIEAMTSMMLDGMILISPPMNTMKYNHPEIDGIFATNDSLALMAIKILNELNISVPDDIKLIGFDNSYMAEIITPALSTIAQPIYEIGVKAVEVLLSIINGEEKSNKNIILDIKYIKRETTIL